MEKIKTGECYFRDEQGNLVLAESFQDGAGVITTETTVIEWVVEPQLV